MSAAAAPQNAAATAEVQAFAEDLLAGLSEDQKRIPCRWLYDARGSELFEAITETAEYYPTRTETAILRDAAPKLARAIGAGAALVEYGSGASLKTRLLLDALEAPRVYAPIDVSAAFMQANAASLGEAYPGLAVRPIVGDFLEPLRLPPEAAAPPVIGFFPGSTIGNLDDEEIHRFLMRARRGLGDGAWFVLGADLAKAEEVLLPAYDDAAGVTAAFNLNLLARANREIGANFDLGAFAHEARWNAERSRIEMHLVSQRAQSVEIQGERVAFAAGESIHTENSRKFSIPALIPQLEAAGWRLEETHQDERGYFAVMAL
ncbi:MAG: L-histidine N(alpha)-methyltransferase, partial [Pseudomonadota bacterium]